MTDSSDRTVRRFNPGILQTDEEIRRQFVVRRAELDVVTQTLRDNLDTPCCQHLMIVGRRGMGKTMLLARAAAEIRTDPGLSASVLPVRFMEESLEVRDIGDFWCEALFHFSRECDVVDPVISEELLEVHDKLASRWRGAELAHRSRDTVLEAAERLGRKIVLMVENFRALCEEKGWEDRFGWKLRQTLQTEPQIMLLATATTRLAELDDYESPFYDFFRIVQLDPLDTEECGALWRAVGEQAENGRNLRPLEILTGGNPRLLVIATRFGDSGSLRDLMEQLVILVDEHTEYFRNHLEGIAKMERRVYVAVLDLWRSSSSQEIAERARLDIRETSSLLRRLVDRGAVEVEEAGKRRRYLAAERLYCIYYKLRRERDDATVVRQLIRFMEALFTEEEFSDFVQRLRVDARESPDGGKWLKIARTESRFRSVYEGQLMQELAAAFDEGEFQRVLSEAERILGEEKLSDTDEAGVRLYQIGALLGLERPEEVLARCDDFQRAVASDAPETISVMPAFVLGHKGAALRMLDRHEDALSCFEDAIRRLASHAAGGNPLLAQIHFERGQTLMTLDRPQEASQAAEQAVRLTEDAVLPNFRLLAAKALLLRAQAGFGPAVGERRPLDEEIAACERVIDRFGGDPSLKMRRQVTEAVLAKANLLAFSGDPEPALDALRGIESRFVDDDGESKRAWERMALAIRADALFQSDRVGEASDIVWRLYADLALDSEVEIRLLIAEFIRFSVAGALPESLLQVLDADPKKSSSVAPLTVALKRRAGLAIRTPIEVLQVADDIVEIIELSIQEDRERRLGVHRPLDPTGASSKAPGAGTP